MREPEILRIKSNPVYQELNAYYSQSTVFANMDIAKGGQGTMGQRDGNVLKKDKIVLIIN